jgi:hypothetical protein
MHMTHAGIRLQAWVVLNGLVAVIEREVMSPRPACHHLTTHPAFSGIRRLMPRSEILAACSSRAH